MICSKCKKAVAPKNMARWDIRLCADGGRKRVFRLCSACDVTLNGYMLRAMGDSRAADKISRYRASRA
jgi:hypothetical protein